MPVTTTSAKLIAVSLILSAVGVVFFGTLLDVYTDASLAYWDSTTSVLSIVGMWLTTRKKIENWYFWIAVDVLATGIYVVKGIYFYALLYLIYVGLAFSGLLTWRKSMQRSPVMV